MESLDALKREQLMRAPNRKRKTNDIEEERRKAPSRVSTRMVWDIDEERTREMMEDVGVTQLEDLDNEPMDLDIKPTPPTTSDLSTFSFLGPGHGSHTSLLRPSNGSRFTRTDAAVLNSLNGLSSHNTSFNTDQYTTLSNHRPDPWCILSDEIMLSVFSWLPKSTLVRCARVCRRWNRVSFDESLWRRLDASDKCLKKGTLGIILDRVSIALRLTNAEIHAPIYNLNPMFTRQRYCRLLYLDLSMAAVAVEGLEQILSQCTSLYKLSLENCQVNDAICRYIGQNQCLQTLNMALCQGLTENALVPICNNLQRLLELNVAWTNMSRGAVVYLVTCLPASLIRLNLSGNRESLTDEDVQQLCNSCPELRELDLSDARPLTALSVGYIVDGLKHLEYLALSRCYNILPSSLFTLTDLPCLVAFDMFGMLKEAALDWLKETLTRVRHINGFPLSSIARPSTVGPLSRTIWGIRVADPC